MPDVSVTNADWKMGVKKKKNMNLGTYRKTKKGNYMRNSKGRRRQ